MGLCKVAVVGLGGMGRRHLQAAQLAGMDVVAICDLNEAAASVAKEMGRPVPQVYTDWQQLLEAECAGIDVLVVATNGPSHAEVTIAAAKSGIPYILCEKPMATSGRNAREMVDVCGNFGSRLAVNFSRRFMDCHIRLKDALKKGTIGEIAHVNVVIGAGGLGCHHFDFVAWLIESRPAWVIGTVEADPAQNVRGPQFVDPGGKGMMGYANGTTAMFELSENVPVGESMQIIGTEGVVRFEIWHPDASKQFAIFALSDADRHIPPTRFVPRECVPFDAGESPDVVQAARAALEDLVGAHREDTAKAGIDVVDTVMAFHLSAQENWRKIDLPLTGEQLLFDVPIT